MKTLFYTALAALSLFVFSCKKEAKISDAPAPKAEKVPVQFSLAGFGNEVTDMNARKNAGLDASGLRDSALQRSIKHLYLIVFNVGTEAYERVTFKHQDFAADSTHFGILSDSLAPGPYYVYFVGASTPPPFVIGTPPSFLNSSTIKFEGPNGPLPVPDLFYKMQFITIGANDSMPYANITLPRIIGNLEVNILDAVDRGPGMDSVEVTMNGDSKIFDFAWDQVMDHQLNRKISKRSVTKYADNVMNVNYPFSVTIKYTNRVTGAITTKVVNNVRCYANKKTVLSGNIYSTDPDGFKISVNDTWVPGDVIQF